MSKPHKNFIDPFIELHHQGLYEYAQDWIKKYKNIQIKRVVLYRYDTDLYDLIISIERKRTDSLSQIEREKNVSLSKRVSEDSHPVLYAIVFEISNCLKTTYPIEYLDYPSNMEYVTTGSQKDLQDITCIEFMKDCYQAYWYKSHNRPHPFLNSNFRDMVYTPPPEHRNFRKDWRFFYQRPDDTLNPNILTTKPPLVLYDCERSVEKDGILFKREEADIQNTTTEQHPYAFNDKKAFLFQPNIKWEDVKIILVENDIVRIETPKGKGRYNCSELEMEHKTANKPTMLWELFKLFTENNGRVSSDNIKYDPSLPDTAKRLNQHLKQLFGIKESIYKYHYKKHKAYITKIKFIDQTEKRTGKQEEAFSEYTNNKKSIFDDEVKEINSKLNLPDKSYL